MIDSKTYWATEVGRDYIDSLHSKIKDYYRDLEITGLYYVWLKSYRAYYGARLTGMHDRNVPLFSGSEIGRTGVRGEITFLKINHYRNLLQHTIQLATSEKPAWSCRAVNTDYKSQAQCIFGTGLLDYYYYEKGFAKHYRHLVENAVVFSEGILHFPWNESIGSQVDVDYQANPDGVPIHEGDFEFSVHTPLDVVRDIYLHSPEEAKWAMIRKFANKYDLMAKYPIFADDIAKVSSHTSFEYQEYDSFNLLIRNGSEMESDLIPLWTFYHLKTEALPQGRMTIFTSDIQLFDGPLPYPELPIVSIRPETLIGTPYGFSPAFDLIAPQQALDILTSTVLTNQASNGVQNIWTKKGDPLSTTELEGGLRVIQSEEKPEGINLTHTPPEIFNFRTTLIAEMETIYGINATVRGNPEANLKSGAALALVVSQSIQFASVLEDTVNDALAEFGTRFFKFLKTFAKSERIASIIGENARNYQTAFEPDKALDGISRVTVERVAAISKTVAGKIQLADSLLERGLITDPKQYIMVVQTGQLDPIIENIQDLKLNIRAENEALRRGEQVTVIITENHMEHIKGHAPIIETPEAKQDPEFISRGLAHIQDHIDKWKSMPPELATMTGQQPPPAVMGAMGGNPANGPVNPNQPPGQQGVPSPGAVMQAPNGPIGPQQMPSMPNMPSLPKGSPPEAQAAYERAIGSSLKHDFLKTMK